MSYMQLLDPKGFAKEKSKKKAPNYGPPQSRKPITSEPSEPKTSSLKLDPKALLNPKAAAGRDNNKPSDLDDSTTGDASATMDAEKSENQPGMSAMLERQYNLTSREAPAPQKRKSELINDDGGEDEERKKTKTTFTIPKSGGELGEYLKAEQKKGALETGPSTEPIDLTNDEDDVVIVGESNSTDEKEVCLGRLDARTVAWQIPQVPKYQMGKMGKDSWPQTRVAYRRLPGQNSIIELISRPTNNSNTGIKFGNMEGPLATVLCPLLDGNNVNKMRLKIYVESFPKRAGEFPGYKTSRNLPLSVIIYAPRKRAEMIGRFLSQKEKFLRPPKAVDPGVEYYNPHDMPKIFGRVGQTARKPQSSQASYVLSRTQEEILRETSNMFDSLIKSENLPEMEANDLIVTPLMAHQKKALYFLKQHERVDQNASEPNSGFSLWKPRATKSGGEAWYNVITSHEVSKKPETTQGGILADVMGLGKTLSVLSLVSDSLVEARAFGEEEAPINEVELKRNSKATLIICPKSVMSNWTEQIQTHTKAGRFKVYSYHGTNRTRDVNELAGHNIVLVPYQTAAAEFSDTLGKRSALASINWFRIVLDEAHQIRNPTTNVSKACCKLSAQRRWAVTGTPVQNKLDDLGALIKFLRIKPFDDSTSWSQHIIAPFRTADANVLTNLRLLVDSITLRRMKDNIGLTERKEWVERLNFSDDEQLVYSQFSKSSNMQLRLMLTDGNRLKGKSYAHVLKALSRLRALCAHGREMLSEEDMRELDGLTAGTAIDLGDEPTSEPDDTFITEKHAYETLDMMRDSDLDQCVGCNRKIGEREDSGDADVVELDESDDDDGENDNEEEEDTLGYLTPCFHLLCQKCKDTFIDLTTPNLTEDHYHECPYCEQYVRWGLFELTRLGLKSMLTARANKNKKGAKWDESTYSGPHTKVKALLNALLESQEETAQLPPEEPPIRSVVFSGWTTYLDLIEFALDEREIGYVRLDGSMSVKARSAVLKTFSTEDNIAVMLVSIKAGGQGLNFTAANKVYMMEPQFNPGVEVQAIDRVHRLGQKRDVKVIHYIMRDSVEEKIVKLQDKKKKLAEMSMEKKMSRSEESKKRIEELRDLFK